MKVLTLFSLAAAVCCGSSLLRAADVASQDLAEMTGTWQITSLDSFGVRKTQPKELQIADGFLTMGGEKYKITLNPSADPQQIDLQNTEFAAQVFRGIYEYGDGTMRLSFGHWDRAADSPNARPRSFNSDNADYLHLRLEKAP